MGKESIHTAMEAITKANINPSLTNTAIRWHSRTLMDYDMGEVYVFTQMGTSKTEMIVIIPIYYAHMHTVQY